MRLFGFVQMEMARLEKIGCFGLTEPLVGSGTGGGLTTTAKREGDTARFDVATLAPAA